jgi:23S rRNA (cytosine1962-C5)-methyltransferase
MLERSLDVEFDALWARGRAERAAALRAGDPLLTGTNAFRVIHGENDYMPGVVLDFYAGTGVMAFDGAGAEAFWAARGEPIAAGCRDAGIPLRRIWARPRGADGTAGGGVALWGDEPPEVVTIEEHGARFEVDVRRGQKTGLFLDQRDNRRRVRALAAGAEVLNLFSYTGGFSVHAALGGARRVTTLDISEGVIAAARRNFARNGIDTAEHVFVAADAFDYLKLCWSEHRRYELVICDPPSFAHSERARSGALRAYRRLNARALEAVERGGLLVTASCSSHVSEEDLLAAVAEAGAKAKRSVRVKQILGAASDHPVLPAFPEGRYLTVLVAYVD